MAGPQQVVTADRQGQLRPGAREGQREPLGVGGPCRERHGQSGPRHPTQPLPDPAVNASFFGVQQQGREGMNLI